MIVPFLAFGFLGWLLENSGGEHRYSKAFGGAPVPFLPVYAIGGALVWVAAPHLKALGLAGKLAVYTLGLSVLEYGACQLDRQISSEPSWGYGPEGVCVDFPHAIRWGVLGTAIGKARMLF